MCNQQNQRLWKHYENTHFEHNKSTIDEKNTTFAPNFATLNRFYC